MTAKGKLYEVMVDTLGTGLHGQSQHSRGDLLRAGDFRGMEVDDLVARGVVREAPELERNVADDGLTSTTQPVEGQPGADSGTTPFAYGTNPEDSAPPKATRRVKE